MSQQKGRSGWKDLPLLIIAEINLCENKEGSSDCDSIWAKDPGSCGEANKDLVDMNFESSRQTEIQGMMHTSKEGR